MIEGQNYRLVDDELPVKLLEDMLWLDPRRGIGLEGFNSLVF